MQSRLGQIRARAAAAMPLPPPPVPPTHPSNPESSSFHPVAIACDAQYLARYGHAPQVVMTASRSLTSTVQLGEMSAVQLGGHGSGHAPHVVITARRSLTSTWPLPAMSAGQGSVSVKPFVGPVA